MGFFDFVTDAGKKLWGGDDDEAAAAEALEKEVKDLGLGGDVEIKVEGDTVKIAGMAPSQEVKEKIILAAGNIAGIGKVEEEIKADVEEEPATFHTVEKGDTLWAVAKKAYGDGSKYNAIFEANRPMLSDPDKIYPGQVLRIPKLG
ncbi:MAG: peptidoglycan-binding protein LysM [Hyphomicrobiales bacterium]|nr:MAG: peptidoglycan-binding protein LysM [Hyphomicrobiales bacterium]